jgi:hypothetical protein
MSVALLYSDTNNSYNRGHNSAVLAPRMGDEMALVRMLQAWEHYAIAYTLCTEGQKLGDFRESVKTKSWLEQARNIFNLATASTSSRLVTDRVSIFIRQIITEQGISDFSLSS